MKSVLISIRPKWCELIASGKKTVEVRKTRPKLDLPFKCYIYCTKGKGDCLWRWNGIWHDTQDPTHRPNRMDGKVIGEFVCDAIFPISCYYSNTAARGIHRDQPYTCLTDKEMIDYLGNGVEGCGWHISDLVIYDKPRELSEFRHECNGICLDTKKKIKCKYLHKRLDKAGFACNRLKPIEKAPQSWCYVEGREENAE